MISSETKISLSPFANWYTNFILDVWSSPNFFQNSSNFILPKNDYFKNNVNGLLAYGARNCVILCQIHGTTVRFNRSVKPYPSVYEKVNAVSFARCLKTPKLFIGSNQGKVYIYHIEKNVMQTIDPIDIKSGPDLIINSVDWADDVDVYYSKGSHVIQWNTETNVYYSVDFGSLVKNRQSKIISIKLTKVDPLLLAVGFVGGNVSIVKLDGASIVDYNLLYTLYHSSDEITSMSFPFSNGEYETGILAVISRQGLLKVWELDSRKILAEQHFATKGDKSKAKNFFSLAFVPKPPPTKPRKAKKSTTESNQSQESIENDEPEPPKIEESESNEIRESESNEIEASETIEIKEPENDVIVVETANDPTEKEKEKEKEFENCRYFLKLLVSRTDGKIVLIDIPADKRETRFNPLKRPEPINVNKIHHNNVVFNISVVNPFHYIVTENKRSIQPFWNMKFFASSLSIDRQIIIYDLKKMQSVQPSFPTVSLQVHDLDFYPADYTKLLIACGDGLKIWYFNHNARDLPNKGPPNYRIDSVSNVPPSTKIVSAAWHPKDRDGESLIGFGTEDGTFICVELNKQVKVYSSEHKLTGYKSRVYACKWGPIPSEFSSNLTRNWACYTVYAAGSIRAHVVTDSKAFSLDQLSDHSVARDNLDKTELVWKDDYNYIAIGYEDGQIMICANDGHFKSAVVLDIHTAPISCIRWHPDNLYQYDCKLKNKVVYKDKAKHEYWIASASRDITVELTDLKFHLIEYNESKKLVHVTESDKTLCGHQDNVISIAWNMVDQDLLATCSADTTVQVWHIDCEAPMYSFRGHWSKVFAIAWAPWDSNLIFSGGDDSTLQVWSPSEMRNSQHPRLVASLRDLRNESPVPEVNEPSPTKYDYLKPIEQVHRDDEQYSALESSNEHDVNQVLDSTTEKIINFPVGKIVESITSATPESGTPKVSPETKPSSKAQNGRTSRSPGHPDTIINRLRNSDKVMAEISYKDKKKSLLPRSNIMENCSTKLQTLRDIEFLLSKRYQLISSDINDNELRTRNLIFLDKDEIKELCEIEISNHKENTNFPLAFQISALQGNLKDMITEAVKTSQLSDWMVSQAASISREFWSKTVLAYAVQLEKSGDSIQAALYYSTIHRIIDAARVLVNAGLYKEALILVKSRETYNTHLIKDILSAWAKVKQNDTNYEFAAKVHIANMDTTEASNCLGKRIDDPKCQQLKRLIDSAEPVNLNEEIDPDQPSTSK
ncbi:gem-associated protein 5-like [Panonychus citri]|uniref:gem-associated protein 5-like n=1 Tax=Panonychus citri TaxID=50023 RepID=UPI002307C3DD|nr:gem-associated protein 5-like [Panonychus citri]